MKLRNIDFQYQNLKYYKKSLKQFYDMVKNSGLDEDEFITKLSFQILKK